MCGSEQFNKHKLLSGFRIAGNALKSRAVGSVSLQRRTPLYGAIWFPKVTLSPLSKTNSNLASDRFPGQSSKRRPWELRPHGSYQETRGQRSLQNRLRNYLGFPTLRNLSVSALCHYVRCRIILQEEHLLGCNTVYFGEKPTFRRNVVPPPYSGSNTKPSK
jgi:hypothetical protein